MPLNFSYVIELINDLALKKENDKHNKVNQERIAELKNSIENQDFKRIDLLISELLKENLSNEQIDELLHLIPFLLDINQYKVASNINKEIIKRDKNNIFTRATNFYDKLIKELKEISELDNNKKELYLNCINLGKEQQRQNNFQDALGIFQYGLANTNIQLFAYYDIEEYTDQTARQLTEEAIREKALNHLSIYDEIGAYKLFNCKHYMSKILIYLPHYKTDKTGKSMKYYKRGKAMQFATDAEYFSGLLNENYTTKLMYATAPNDKDLTNLFKTIRINVNFFNKPNKFLEKRIEKKRQRKIPKKRRSNECNN